MLALLFGMAPTHAATPTPTAPSTPTVRKADLDAAIDAAMSRYGLPGLAVGVVVDGNVAYVRTAGELEAGGGKAVDADTVFKIASNTKAMTTALLARLVDAGKLRWDDPVVKHLPGFRMHDPWVTREMQVRDLLIHNSGLGAGAGDLMLWPDPNRFSRADVIRGLRHLKPLHSFRSRYAYDNTLYIVAGEVAAAAGGAPYEELVRREVFAPLGMARCHAGDWDPAAVGNVAQPHRKVAGRNVVDREANPSPASPMEAAGGIRCSLTDMLKWVATWLEPERHQVAGKPWLSDAQREALWTAHMPMPLSGRMRRWDRSHYSAYGYGWRLADVDGTQKVSHTGTLSGMYSSVTLLPELGAGFVILLNGDADEARTVLGQVLVKHFTAPARQLTVVDVAGDLAAEAARTAAQQAKEDSQVAAGKQVATGRQVATSPGSGTRSPVTPAQAERWVGRYRDPWFGEVALCPRGAEVRFVSVMSPLLSGTVRRMAGRMLVDWDEDAVDAEAWLDPAGTAAGPATFTMAKVDPQADFSYDYEDLAFTRVADCPAG